MGVFGGFIGWTLFWGLRRFKINLFWAGFMAGFIGDLAIYVGTSTQLALAIHGTHPFREVFQAILIVFIPTQWPIAVLEGIFTGLVLKYIADHRPDILIMLHILPASEGVKNVSLENTLI